MTNPTKRQAVLTRKVKSPSSDRFRVVRDATETARQGQGGDSASLKAMAELAASFTPVVGDAMSARDAYRSFKGGDMLGAVLGTVGAIPLAGTVGDVARMGRRAVDPTAKAANEARRLEEITKLREHMPLATPDAVITPGKPGEWGDWATDVLGVAEGFTDGSWALRESRKGVARQYGNLSDAVASFAKYAQDRAVGKTTQDAWAGFLQSPESVVLSDNQIKNIGRILRESGVINPVRKKR